MAVDAIRVLVDPVDGQLAAALASGPTDTTVPPELLLDQPISAGDFFGSAVPDLPST